MSLSVSPAKQQAPPRLSLVAAQAALAASLLNGEDGVTMNYVFAVPKDHVDYSAEESVYWDSTAADSESLEEMEAHLRFLNMDLEMEVLDLEACNIGIGKDVSNGPVGDLTLQQSGEPISTRLRLRAELAKARQSRSHDTSADVAVAAAIQENLDDQVFGLTEREVVEEDPFEAGDDQTELEGYQSEQFISLSPDPMQVELLVFPEPFEPFEEKMLLSDQNLGPVREKSSTTPEMKLGEVSPCHTTVINELKSEAADAAVSARKVTKKLVTVRSPPREPRTRAETRLSECDQAKSRINDGEVEEAPNEDLAEVITDEEEAQETQETHELADDTRSLSDVKKKPGVEHFQKKQKGAEKRDRNSEPELTDEEAVIDMNRPLKQLRAKGTKKKIDHLAPGDQNDKFCEESVIDEAVHSRRGSEEANQRKMEAEAEGSLQLAGAGAGQDEAAEEVIDEPRQKSVKSKELRKKVLIHQRKPETRSSKKKMRDQKAQDHRFHASAEAVELSEDEKTSKAAAESTTAQLTSREQAQVDTKGKMRQKPQTRSDRKKLTQQKLEAGSDRTIERPKSHARDREDLPEEEKTPGVRRKPETRSERKRMTETKQCVEPDTNAAAVELEKNQLQNKARQVSTVASRSGANPKPEAVRLSRVRTRSASKAEALGIAGKTKSKIIPTTINAKVVTEVIGKLSGKTCEAEQSTTVIRGSKIKRKRGEPVSL